MRLTEPAAQLLTRGTSRRVAELPLPDFEISFVGQGGFPPGSIDGFTRSSNATFVNVGGVLETVGNDAVRIDHDPVGGHPLGLLMEGTATNLALRSEEFDNATWSNTRSSESANTAAAPDGNTVADTLIEDATAGNTHYLRQSFTKAASAIAYTFSLYAKASSRTNLTLHVDDNSLDGGKVNFDLSTGAAGGVSMVNFTSGSAAIEDAGSGWYRCAFTFTTTTATALNTDLRLHDGTSDSYNGDGSSGLFVWGAQLEQASYTTSYIKTEGSAVARAADLATLAPPFYRAAEGTFLVEGSVSSYVADGIRRTFAEFDDGSDSNVVRIALRGTADDALQAVHSGGVAVAIPFGDTVPAGETRKHALAYRINDFIGAFDGRIVGTDSLGAVPVGIDTLRLGGESGGTGPLNGHIARLAYWRWHMTSAELQALTQ